MARLRSLGQTAVRRPDDQRLDELRRLRRRRVLDVGDREARGLDRPERLPIAVAADDQAVQPVHPVLEAREVRILGADVLEEEETPSGTQDTANLAERPLLIGTAEHERRDDDVEARVFEGQILGGSLHNLGLLRLLARLGLEPAEHRRFGLGDNERLGPVVERQVQASAPADLEHPPGCVREQRLAQLTHTALLGLVRESVVDRRHERPAKAHSASLRLRVPRSVIVNPVVQYSQPVDRAFAALADPTRRAVLERLGSGSATISELAEPFGMTLTGMKKHIRLLEDAELVTTEKIGRAHRCMLAPYAFEGISTGLQRRGCV